jgi:hypothetical protein
MIAASMNKVRTNRRGFAVVSFMGGTRARACAETFRLHGSGDKWAIPPVPAKAGRKVEFAAGCKGAKRGRLSPPAWRHSRESGNSVRTADRRLPAKQITALRGQAGQCQFEILE